MFKDIYMPMRSLSSGSLLLSILFAGEAIFASDELLQEVQLEPQSEVAVVLTRTDSIPDGVEKAPDAYFEGYIQALVDMNYLQYSVVVISKDKHIWLANLPKNELTAKSIVQFVKDVPGVKSVQVLDGVPPENEEL